MINKENKEIMKNLTDEELKKEIFIFSYGAVFLFDKEAQEILKAMEKELEKRKKNEI